MAKRKYNAGTGRKRARALLLALALVLIVMAAVGDAVALKKGSSGPVTNTFASASVTCAVTEDFDGTVKKDVNAENTGEVPAYVRVRLATYRVNDDDDHIGGAAPIPTFTPGTNWVKYGDYYYYTKPVAPGESPENPLIGSDGITLQDYDDADGGRQVIEVMAEAIQGVPPEAAGEAWGVAISENNVTAYSEGGGT